MTAAGTWDQDTFAAAVAEAVSSTSIHNSQPWRFRRTGQGIDVLVDQGRVLPVSDPDGRAARVSCGAAVCNLTSGARGRRTPFVFFFWPGGAAVGTDPGRVHEWSPSARLFTYAFVYL